MGERAPEPSFPAPSATRSRMGWVVMGIGLLVALWAAWPRPAVDALEVTQWMQARSLVSDLDRRWGPRDSARLEAWGRERREAMLPDPLVLPRVSGDVYDAPVVPALLLAPAALTGSVRIALAWQVLLVVAALYVALSAVQRRVGRPAAGLVGLFLVGSAAFPSLFHLWPDPLVMALVAASLGLAWGGGHPGVAEETADVYQGAWGESRRRSALRWLGAGLLLGAAVASRGYLAPLGLALFVSLPRDRRRLAAGLAGVGLALPLAGGAGWALATGEPWGLEVPSFDPELLRWAALDLAVGRNVGLLVCFAPVALILFACSGREGRWVPFVAGLSAVVALLLWSPFDVAGGPWAAGNRLLLGVYPAFWFAVDSLPSRWVRVAAWAVAASLVWPWWLAPRAVPSGTERPDRMPPAYLSPWLPVETTQRSLIEGLPRVRSAGVEVFLPAGGVAPGSRPGELVMDDGATVELLLRSERPVVGLRIEAEETAGVDVALRGAELQQTVFRPDGSSGFRISFQDGGRRHPLEPGGSDVHYRRFGVGFPKAPDRPLRIRLGGIETALSPGESL